MRKHSLNHKFITKGEFKDIYEELCTYLSINPENVHGLLRKKETATSNAREIPHRRIFSVEKTM
jgi:hypothetical protein